MKSAILGKVVLVSALSFFAGPLLADDAGATNSGAATPAVTPSDFVWDASLINLEEIRLGEAAQTNSQNTGVQDFGKHMVRDHVRLNERLTKIAKAEGLELPATNIFDVEVMAPPEEKEATELLTETPQQRLQRAQWDVHSLTLLTGPDFDHAYVDAIVKGHAKVVEKFQDASASLQDEQLKRYADRGLPVIRHHYEMAQKLHSEVETNAPGGTTAPPNM